MAMSKNSRIGRVRSGFYDADSGTLRKFNYSNGAGWRTKKKGKIHFKIRTFDLGTGRRAYLKSAN